MAELDALARAFQSLKVPIPTAFRKKTAAVPIQARLKYFVEYLVKHGRVTADEVIKILLDELGKSDEEAYRILDQLTERASTPRISVEKAEPRAENAVALSYRIKRASAAAVTALLKERFGPRADEFTLSPMPPLSVTVDYPATLFGPELADRIVNGEIELAIDVTRFFPKNRSPHPDFLAAYPSGLIKDLGATLENRSGRVTIDMANPLSAIDPGVLYDSIPPAGLVGEMTLIPVET